MKKVIKEYRGKTIEYTAHDNYYEIVIDNNIYTSNALELGVFGEISVEEKCLEHIDKILDELEGYVEPTQDEILAEVLLGQAEIIANQSAQDEVLAEMLLNSLEV